MVLNLNSILVGSENPDKLVEFYTEILGKPGWENGGFTGFQAGSGYFMIGPHSEVKGKNKEPGRVLINFETPDVKGEFTRIKGLGGKVVQEPYNPGEADDEDMLLATFADPDGNYFQIASPMPEDMM